jgi:hypothetical protein
MQNRRVPDSNFRATGVEIRAAIDTNRGLALVAHSLRALVDGRAQYGSSLAAPATGVIALPLVDPVASQVLGFVTPIASRYRHSRANSSRSARRSLFPHA